jgi:hypothetical protein
LRRAENRALFVFLARLALPKAAANVTGDASPIAARHRLFAAREAARPLIKRRKP